MDPHSTLSQFNQRVPKAGPIPRSQEQMSSQKRSQKRKIQPQLLSPSSDTPERPIATNSRIKQDEKYRRDMYLAFVNNAVQQKSAGVSEPFDELVSQFNIKRSKDSSTPLYQPAQLRLWFSALSHVVSRLERTHTPLVQAIVNMPWTTLDNSTVKYYTNFIANLLSARPEYLSLVLSRIAHGFTHQSGLQALDNVGPEASSTPLTRRIIYDRLHDLLQHLLSLIPTLLSTLKPLLIRNFPHKRQNEVYQATFIRNLLRISTYCPGLADELLSTIIDRAIQIDVEIQVELEELEEAEAGDQEDIFELDPFDAVVGEEDESSDGSGDEGSEGGDNFSELSSDQEEDLENVVDVPSNLGHIQDMVKKLDVILTLIFEHFERTYALATITPSKDNTSNNTATQLPPLPTDTDTDPASLLSPPSSTTPPSQEKLATTQPPFLSPFKRLRSQFYTLLSIFDRTILRTFKSRYTQFLVFWFTSLDPEFADTFQGMLVDRALFASDSSFHTLPTESTLAGSENRSAIGAISAPTPTVTRAAAASYIGSFVSRATFIDRVNTRHIVGVLCEFLRAHIDAVDEVIRVWGAASVHPNNAGKGSNVLGREQNTIFYAVAQAVFLIFCFRWRDLLEDPEGQGEDDAVGPSISVSMSAGLVGKKWIPELGVLQRVVTSILNPLKVCSSNVVLQFARVAHATDFLYCYSILESNKRSEYAVRSSIGSNSSPINCLPSSSVIHPAVLIGESLTTELNTFFPFDPYRLQRSSSFIQGIYREWSSVAIEEEDEDGEDADADLDENETESKASLQDQGDSDDLEDDKPEKTSQTRTLNIPGKALSDNATDGLGASLNAMSISPAIPGISVANKVLNSGMV
ncbi:hypothetical protein AMATHDRAFT_59411 [Amanita thiersii Skay4041]|uniref:RNA polymerase I-specific transcription initiation factor RRN3 n=1 Tax=Amanita thiersii Skay4041 TaxID=703135 RepID=A0A2A9NMK5_9AGAR|nr:hypothetical protein AMATHDRAFT_59411 [Amanita thiersii Skay4041]